jgi:hypothetical protein
VAKDKRTDVGYGRPPVDKQFKPGQSGNPRGRPKGRKGIRQMFLDLANRKVTITESGRRRTVTKAEVALTQIINKAAAGSERALNLFIGLMQQAEPGSSTTPFNRAEDEAVMQSLSLKFRQVYDEGDGA